MSKFLGVTLIRLE